MLKKGDVVSVSYRSGSHIKVSYRVIGKSDEGKEEVEVHTMSFNVNSPDFVSVTPQNK